MQPIAKLSPPLPVSLVNRPFGGGGEGLDMSSAGTAVVTVAVVAFGFCGCSSASDAPAQKQTPPAAPTAAAPTPPAVADVPIGAISSFDSIQARGKNGLWCALGGVCYSVASDASMLYRIGPRDTAVAPEVAMPGDATFSLSLGAGAIFLRTAAGVFSTADGVGAWSQETLAPKNPSAFAAGHDGRLYVAALETWDVQARMPIFVNDDPSHATAEFRVAGAACHSTVRSIAVSASHDIYAIVGDSDPAEVYVMRDGGPLWQQLPLDAAITDRVVLDASGNVHVVGAAKTCRLSAASTGPDCVNPTLDVYSMTAVVIDSAGTPFVAASDDQHRWAVYEGSYTTAQWRLRATLPALPISASCTDIANDHVGDLLIRCGDNVYRSKP
jgi:hypothetical protein